MEGHDQIKMFSGALRRIGAPHLLRAGAPLPTFKFVPAPLQVGYTVVNVGLFCSFGALCSVGFSTNDKRQMALNLLKIESRDALATKV